jgi:hypothetical protein
MASPYHLAGRDQPLGTHLAESAEPIPRPALRGGDRQAIARLAALLAVPADVGRFECILVPDWYADQGARCDDRFVRV